MTAWKLEKSIFGTCCMDSGDEGKNNVQVNVLKHAKKQNQAAIWSF